MYLSDEQHSKLEKLNGTLFCWLELKEWIEKQKHTHMKELKLKQDVRISELKNQFNRIFPYLKLEFFKTAHTTNEGSPKKDLIMQDLLLNELGINETKTLSIPSGITANQLEEIFKIQFGMNMQVFWKSGNIWLETINYDSWLLTELNLHAEERNEKII